MEKFNQYFYSVMLERELDISGILLSSIVFIQSHLKWLRPKGREI